jgi:hypothetical protein
MPFPVYSTAFIVEQGLTGSIAFEVPAGYIAVVRSIDCYANVTFDVVDLHVYREVQQACFCYMHWVVVDQNSKHWDGRQVVYSEDSIVANNIGAHPVDVSISGYLLSTTPG